jgi:hypothetical protein
MVSLQGLTFGEHGVNLVINEFSKRPWTYKFPPNWHSVHEKSGLGKQQMQYPKGKKAHTYGPVECHSRDAVGAVAFENESQGYQSHYDRYNGDNYTLHRFFRRGVVMRILSAISMPQFENGYQEGNPKLMN